MASSALQNCRASTKNTCPPGMFAAVETVTAQSVKNSRLLPPSLGLLPCRLGSEGHEIYELDTETPGETRDREASEARHLESIRVQLDGAATIRH